MSGGAASGSGSGRPPVVLIHGMWGRGEQWAGLMARFACEFPTLLAPSLPGHGAEPAPAGGLGRLGLADYRAHLERILAGLDRRPFLVGHSMGGLLALQLATRGLARAALLLAPAPPPPHLALAPATLRALGRPLLGAAFRGEPFRLGDRAADAAFLDQLPPETAARVRATLGAESGRALFEIAWWFLDRRGAARVDASALRCPLLFIAGTADRLVPAAAVRRTARRYGDRTRCHLLPDRGHWLLDGPAADEVAMLALPWLDEALSGDR